MKLNQIATLLNETIVPNLLGEGTTIAADLSNIVDIGTAMANIDADTVQNYAKSFIAGVARNYFDTRKYEGSDYGLMIDSKEYGGVIQRVKAGLQETSDSPIWTLQNGTDYFDGKYYGIDVNNKIYSEDTIFMVTNSIPTEMYKQYFTSADGVQQLISLIESSIDNTVTFNLEGTAKSIYQALIKNGNKINLRSLYNTNAGTSLTANEFLHNSTALRWAAEQISRLRMMIRNFNKKYNDGTIETFTPAEDTFVTLLTEFSKAMQYNMEADTFHNDLVSVGSFNEIDFWQNSGTDLLPSLGVTAEVKVDNGSGEEPTTISNVVSVIHDRFTCGMTARLDKITASYIPKGDFTTYFHHIAKSQFIDTRNTAIVLTLN